MYKPNDYDRDASTASTSYGVELYTDTMDHQVVTASPFDYLGDLDQHHATHTKSISSNRNTNSNNGAVNNNSNSNNDNSHVLNTSDANPNNMFQFAGHQSTTSTTLPTLLGQTMVGGTSLQSSSRSAAEMLTASAQRSAMLTAKLNKKEDEIEVLEQLLAKSRKDASRAHDAHDRSSADVAKAKKTVKSLVDELTFHQQRVDTLERQYAECKLVGTTCLADKEQLQTQLTAVEAKHALELAHAHEESTTYATMIAEQKEIQSTLDTRVQELMDELKQRDTTHQSSLAAISEKFEVLGSQWKQLLAEKDTEARELVMSKEAAETQLKQLQHTVATKTNECEDMQHKMNTMETSLAEERIRLLEKVAVGDAALEAAHDEMDNSNRILCEEHAQLELLTTNGTRLLHELEAKKEETARVKLEVAEMRSKLELADERNTHHNQQAAVMQQQILEIEKLRLHVETYQQRLHAQTSEVEQYREQLVRKSSVITKLEQDRDDHAHARRRDLEEANAKVDVEKQLVQQLRNEITTMELTHARNIGQLTDTIAKLEKKCEGFETDQLQQHQLHQQQRQHQQQQHTLMTLQLQSQIDELEKKVQTTAFEAIEQTTQHEDQLQRQRVHHTTSQQQIATELEQSRRDVANLHQELEQLKKTHQQSHLKHVEIAKEQASQADALVQQLNLCESMMTEQLRVRQDLEYQLNIKTNELEVVRDKLTQNEYRAHRLEQGLHRLRQATDVVALETGTWRQNDTTTKPNTTNNNNNNNNNNNSNNNNYNNNDSNSNSNNNNNTNNNDDNNNSNNNSYNSSQIYNDNTSYDDNNNNGNGNSGGNNSNRVNYGNRSNNDHRHNTNNNPNTNTYHNNNDDGDDDDNDNNSRHYTRNNSSHGGSNHPSHHTHHPYHGGHEVNSINSINSIHSGSSIASLSPSRPPRKTMDEMQHERDAVNSLTASLERLYSSIETTTKN